MYKIASTRATRRPDTPRATRHARGRASATGSSAPAFAPRGAVVSDAVVVDVVRVGDERLTISETLRLSLPRGVAVAFRSRASRASRDTRARPLNFEILNYSNEEKIYAIRGAETLDAITHLATSGSVDSALARANRW